LRLPGARTGELSGYRSIRYIRSRTTLRERCGDRKNPRISEHDVVAFYPYAAANGTYGVLFQLDDHGRIALDALSIERRGSLLFVFINGRPLTELAMEQARFRRKDLHRFRTDCGGH